MDSSEQILNTSLDDLIFKDRNKLYGAYYLRKIYSKNANKATIITLLVFLLFVNIPFIYGLIHGAPVVPKIKAATAANLAPPPPMDKTTPPPPPPPNMPKPPKQLKFVPPIIVNTPPPPEEAPPTQQELQVTPPAAETDPNANYSIPAGNDQGSKVIDDQNKVFTFVEQMPEFPGGDAALLQFLQKNIHYPPAARENNVEGTVYITFVVDQNGNISDIKVLRDIGGGCGDEAIRVVKAMPAWKPGRQNGNNVKVQFNLPIKFQLSSE
jgi:periplasmic protein TonB